jgi:hypothetical protein
LAPFIFCTFMAEITAFLRAHGVSVVSYVDDLLFTAGSQKEAEDLIITLLDFFSFLHIKLNTDPKKSCLIPARKVVFLGMEVDAKLQRFVVPEEKLNKFLKLVLSLVKKGNKKKVKVREVATVAGILQSLSLALPPARPLASSLYKAIETREHWG